MRPINEIIIHCAATPDGWGDNMTPQQIVDEITVWHKKRGFDTIGYHYIITRNGVVAKGRPIEKIGAHVKGHNTGTIGICIIGGATSSADDKFSDNYTPAQDYALRKLIDDLREQFPSIAKVSGHNEYAAKACPGFRVKTWFDQGMSAQRKVSQSTTVRASAAAIGSGVATGANAFGMFGEKAQIVMAVAATIIILSGMWIMRERLKRWANGDR